MITRPGTVVAVHAGPVAPLGAKRVASAFIKHSVLGPVIVDSHGVAGDAQADKRVHGGVDKAVYAYPATAYAAWHAVTPHHATQLVAGSMGENLTIDGWSDANVAIGDRVRIGSAEFVVSEPRTPCYKLGLAFDDSAMVRAFAVVGISGWYYRVVEPGIITAGDIAHCVARPNPDWTVARVFAAITGAIGSADLEAIAALDGIAERWRIKARKMLAQRGNI